MPNTKAELTTIEQKVAYILNTVPAARNTDRLLIEKYFQEFHGIATFRQLTEAGDSAPSTESIRRIRQKIQASGQYPSDPNIAAYREEKRAEVKAYSRDVVPSLNPDDPYVFNYERLKETRREEGISQHTLARKLNIHQTALTAWENGKSIPNSVVMLSLARALNKPVEYFFTSK